MKQAQTKPAPIQATHSDVPVGTIIRQLEVGVDAIFPSSSYGAINTSITYLQLSLGRKYTRKVGKQTRLVTVTRVK